MWKVHHQAPTVEKNTARREIRTFSFTQSADEEHTTSASKQHSQSQNCAGGMSESFQDPVKHTNTFPSPVGGVLVEAAESQSAAPIHNTTYEMELTKEQSEQLTRYTPAPRSMAVEGQTGEGAEEENTVPL